MQNFSDVAAVGVLNLMTAGYCCLSVKQTKCLKVIGATRSFSFQIAVGSW